MKINAILNKAITAEVAARLAVEASEIKPAYNVVANDPATVGAWIAINRQIEEGHNTDFAIFDHRSFEDGSFTLSVGYYSDLSGNVEAVDVYTDFIDETGAWRLNVDLNCNTTRGAFRERMRPILYAFDIHPSELTVVEIETEAGNRFGDYRGAAMPWWVTKGEYAYFLACGRIEGLSVAEQIGYAAELIHEAVAAELENQFDSRNYPRWVVEFRSDLESAAAVQCSRLVEAWDKFAQATKDLVYGVKEEFKNSEHL